MNKFKVGDRIKPTQEADGKYSYTRGDWRGIVSDIYDDDEIQVKTIGDESQTTTVESRCFELMGVKPGGKTGTKTKNLSSAAKALKRQGPTEIYKVKMNWEKTIEVDATDEEHAEEIAETIWTEGGLTLTRGKEEDNPINIEATKK